MQPEDIEILVLVKIGKHGHQVILSKEEKRLVVATISHLHNMDIKVQAEAVEGLEITKNKKRKTK